jgi:hypothetical protein
MNAAQWKESPVPEPSAIDGVLRALVEAMEARGRRAGPPEWEANARLRAAEASLLRLYRESGHTRSHRVAIDIEIAPPRSSRRRSKSPDAFIAAASARRRTPNPPAPDLSCPPRTADTSHGWAYPVMEPTVLTRATEKPASARRPQDRRLRAVYRRELQNSVFYAALVVGAGAAAAAIFRHPAEPLRAPAYARPLPPLAAACWWPGRPAAVPPVRRPARDAGRPYADPLNRRLGGPDSLGGVGCRRHVRAHSARLRDLHSARAQTAPDLADPGQPGLPRDRLSDRAVWMDPDHPTRNPGRRGNRGRL